MFSCRFCLSGFIQNTLHQKLITNGYIITDHYNLFSRLASHTYILLIFFVGIIVKVYCLFFFIHIESVSDLSMVSA